MKVTIILETGDGRLESATYHDVVAVKDGPGAFELQQSVGGQEQKTESGLVLYTRREQVTRIFIPWHRIESVEAA